MIPRVFRVVRGYSESFHRRYDVIRARAVAGGRENGEGGTPAGSTSCLGGKPTKVTKPPPGRRPGGFPRT